MALVQVVTIETLAGTASLTLGNPAQVDRLDFASNQIVFASSSSFSLSKSDTLLYIKYLTLFNNILLLNFPTIGQFVNLPLPACSFDVSITTGPNRKTDYAQKSGNSTVLNIDYNTNTGLSTFSSRHPSVTISMQEFYMMVYIFNQYSNQVSVA